MPNTCSLVHWRRRPTTVVAVLLALVFLTGISTAQKPQQKPTKSESPASSLSQNTINYFAINEAYSPLAILDLLEATMQVYQNYRLYESGTFENNTYNFTAGVVLVTVTDDELNGPDVFPPNRLKPAYSMQGTSRHLKVPDFVYKRAIQLLRGADELTIGAVVRQERANTGSIVSFSLDSNRYLELESSGRKDEVRLHYVSQGSRRVHTEVFACALADGRWHAVAVTVSGAQARLFVDCRLMYTRTLAAGPADTSFTGSPDLYVGQRNSGEHSVFKGVLQDVRLIRGADGQRVQCPNLDTSCPTCGQFSAMQRTMENLNKIVHMLSDKLEAAETRIADLETCECRKPCVQFDANNKTVMKVDGSVWQHGCETCTCLRGQVECSPFKCPPADCKFPVRMSGECCDTCLKSCRTKGDKVFDHGDTINLEPCLSCICLNGVVKCDKIDAKTQCPFLECDESERFSVPDQCCQFCPGVDYCTRGGRDSCHPDATCINLKTTHKCACAVGYTGTGLQCDDVDECTSVGGPNGHHCDLNTTVCVNTPGSYSCQCNVGYTHLNRFECADVDECSLSDKNFPCHTHATCTNSPGGFSCKCRDGYEGDGLTCRPVCQQQCLNGGVCSSPGVCSCPNAFEGPACELDVDECVTGTHGCLGPSSHCVNMAGWYYCACSPGYQNVIMFPAMSAAVTGSDEQNSLESIWSPQLGTMCQDIDECAINNHTCHPSAVCVNTIGSYECKCPTNTANSSLECKSSCLHKESSTEVVDGGWVLLKECTNCTCSSGRLRCAPVECDCAANNDHALSSCCAQCSAQASCAHQELLNVRFRSGQQWIYQCQTCECLLGQVDCWPMQCPPKFPSGASGCSNASKAAFSEHSNPVADCCEPRCDSNADTSLATSVATTTVAPCVHPEQLGHVTNVGDNGTSLPPVGRPCFYEGRTYQSGDRWNDLVDMCTSCDCKDGVLCCSYNVRHCSSNGSATGVAGRPAGGGNVDLDLSAGQPRRSTTEDVGGTNRQPAVVERRRRRRQAAPAKQTVPGDGGREHGVRGFTTDVHGNENGDRVGSDQGDRSWRTTRRRKRRSHYSVTSKNEDNNVNNDYGIYNGHDHRDRFAVKTVVT